MIRIIAFLACVLPGFALAQPNPPPPQSLYNQIGHWVANQFFASIDGVVYCDQFASLAACYAALPSTGGKMLLPPDTTIVQTSTLTISHPNVTLECPSWATIIQRGPVLNSAQVVYMTGAGDAIRNCTIDGNGSINTSGGSADLQIDATGGLIDHIQAINGGSSVQVALSGAGARVTGSTITGLGSSSVGGYGIWAIGFTPVIIDHNVVSATNTDCIGVSGPGSIVADNRVSNCHDYTGGGGGSIVSYPVKSASYTASISGSVMTVTAIASGAIGFGDTVFDMAGGSKVQTGTQILSDGTGSGGVGTYNLSITYGSPVSSETMYSDASAAGVTFSNNLIQWGANPSSGGYEINSGHTTISGGGIDGGTSAGLSGISVDAMTGPGLTISGILLHNVGLPSGLGDGISIPGGLTDFSITGVQVMDDRPTPLMRFAVNINSGASDRYNISGNKLWPCNRATCLNDNGTGLHKTIKNNQGVDDVIINVASATAMSLPVNPVFHLTQSNNITSLTGWAAAGASKTVIPDNVLTFTAGNNIGNSFTSAANVPFVMTFNGTNWYLK